MSKLSSSLVSPTGARPRIVTAVVAVVASSLLAACAAPVQRTTRVYEEPGYRAARVEPQPVYARYGTVERIEVVDTQVGDSGGGAALGAVVGGVLGNQIGRGSGRAVATVLGVFGGAVAGDQIEQNRAAQASGRVYHVHVRFDDGGHQVFDYAQVNGLRAGERVKFEQGSLLHG